MLQSMNHCIFFHLNKKSSGLQTFWLYLLPKKNYMKQMFFNKVLYAILIPAVMLFSFTKIVGRVNFSGDWKLNEAKSDLGNYAAFAARAIKAEQKDSSITISRTTPGFNGGEPTTRTTTLYYDGRVTESTGFGGSKIKSTCKWADDGQSLTINSNIAFERNGQSNEFKIAETLTLTKEGTLSLVSNSNSPNGDVTTTAIFEKK